MKCWVAKYTEGGLIVSGERLDIECPYCGAIISLFLKPRTIELQGSLSTASLAVSISGGPVAISSIDVSCNFCGSRYRWYRIASRDVVTMIRYTEAFLGWLKRYNLPLEKLESYIIAVVEPKTSRWARLRHPFRRRRHGEAPFKLVELVLKVEREGRIYRAAVPGKLYLKPPFHIDVAPGTWMTGPPPERQISNSLGEGK